MRCRHLMFLIVLLMASSAWAQQFDIGEFGNWTIITVRDEIDDSVSVIATLKGQYLLEEIALDVVCGSERRQEGLPSIVGVSWPDALDESQEVTYRFAPKDAVVTTWPTTVGEDGTRKLLTIPTGSEFLRTVAESERLAIRIVSLEGSTKTASFDLAESREAVAQVLELCPEL